MASDKVYIYDSDDIRLNVIDESNIDVTIINESPSVEVITVYEQGPQGPRGEKGDTPDLPTEIISGSGADSLIPIFVNGGYITGSQRLFLSGSTFGVSGSLYIGTAFGNSVNIAGYDSGNKLSTIYIGSGLNLNDNTLNAVGSLTGTGSIYQVSYWTGSTAISGSSNFVFDYVNGFVGINNPSPVYTLDVSGTIRANSFVGLFPGIISSSQQIKENLPQGTVSGSNQLTSSYDLRYERQGRNIISSSAQIASDITGSFSVMSASISLRVTGLENRTGSYATTGSNTFFGNQTVNGFVSATMFTGSSALITGDVFVGGKVTAREFHTDYVSSSIIYESGSTQFGNSLDDTHIFTGSIYVSGSINTVSHIDFSTSSISPFVPGRVSWNPDFGTLDLGMNGGNVKLSWGLELAAYVVNGESTTLLNGEVVYMSGSRGDKPKVYRASNSMESTSTKTFGVVTEPILPNQLGYVTTQGVVDGLDLGAYNSGDAVWLGSTPGTFTSQKPQAPSHSVFVGIVERANGGNGQLFVAIQNGYELDELHNVRIVSPTNGNLIAYDSSVGLWKNTNIISSSLTVSGSLNVDNLLISGSDNSQLLRVASPSNQNIFLVSGSGNVGIGSNTPNSLLFIQNNNAGGLPNFNSGIILNNSSAASTLGNNAGPAMTFLGKTWSANPGVSNDAYFIIRQDLSEAYTNTGRNALTINSKIGNAAEVNLLKLNSTGQQLEAPNIMTDGAILTSTAGTNLKLYAGSNALIGVNVLYTSNDTNTTGDRVSLGVNNGYAPTSGNSTRTWISVNPTVNQTGGASGITRGLRINPTLTSAADWRSIEWSNNSGWGLYGLGNATNFIAGALLIGSTNRTGKSLEVSGSGNFTGDLIVTGSLTFGTITGSSAYLTGDVFVGGKVTAQEFFTQYVSSSIIYQSGSTKFGDTTDDIHQRTGSMLITGSFSSVGSFSSNGSATFSVNGGSVKLQGAIGGALAYSYAEYIGSTYTAGFKADTNMSLRTGDASRLFLSNTNLPDGLTLFGNRVGLGNQNPAYKLDVSGSGNFTNNLTVTGSFQLSSSLFQYSDNTDVDTGTEVVATIPTSSYRSAFFDYVISSGSNARAGTVFSVWGGSSVEYTETSTNDIGNTNPVSLFAALNGANIELRATTTADNWSVKSLVRML